MEQAQSSAAIVSGGASGIGAATVARLRAADIPVLVLDIAGDYDIACDVSDPAAVEIAVGQCIERLGCPTRVVACAGIGHSGMLIDDKPDDFRRVLDVNLV